MTALPCENRIHGVFREDGDEGEHGYGQPCSDVELSRLGRPREEEGGPNDRDSEQERFDRMGEGVDAPDPKDERRNG